MLLLEGATSSLSSQAFSDLTLLAAKPVISER